MLLHKNFIPGQGILLPHKFPRGLRGEGGRWHLELTDALLLSKTRGSRVSYIAFY